jgi:ankyrin repeat protein
MLLSFKSVRQYVDLNLKDANDWTVLHHAAVENQLDVFEFLLDQEDVQVNAVTSQQTNPLHYLARNKFDALEVQEHMHRILKKWMMRGGLIDPVNSQGETPLFLACLQGGLPAVSLLLDHGADATLLNK